MSQISSPPVCSLEARDFKERVAWIATLNARSLRGHRRQGATLILTYAGEAFPEVQEMVAREQDCCAFLRFDLRKAAETVELGITVPNGQEDNADALLAPFHAAQEASDASSCCGAC
ncbi:hypothetical protein ACFONC_05255 [Luteimonas soli]|uniref:Uncharacterized protein n=1 Tax=Luteimonas soli TaxID=1648966 RepID=A0ABV7XIJ4_9GAMM